MRACRHLAVIAALAVAPYAPGGEPIELAVDGGTLHGTLERPDDAHAAVLIIAGSGPTDRDGNVTSLPGKNNSLRYLAEALAEAGVASLRFDKRMIGQSAIAGLSESDLRFDTYVDDAVAWCKALQEKTGLPTFIAGHSEGALIGTLAAADADAAGLVILAGAGRAAPDLILEQTRRQMPPALLAQTETIVAALSDGRTVDAPPPALAALFRPSVQPYLISWFAHDPADALIALHLPVLLVYGSTDIQVPASDGQRLHEARPDADVVLIDGMNHVLKRVDSDPARQMRSYADPSLPVMPEAVDAVVTFVNRYTAAPRDNKAP